MESEENVTRETLHRMLAMMQQTMENLSSKVDRLLEESDSQQLAVRRQFPQFANGYRRFAGGIGNAEISGGQEYTRFSASNHGKPTA